jgi:hypothetical protein
VTHRAGRRHCRPLLDRLVRTEEDGRPLSEPGIPDGVVGNLWILGHGDPGMGPVRMARLAREVKDASIRRVTGSVIGSTRYSPETGGRRGGSRTSPAPRCLSPPPWCGDGTVRAEGTSRIPSGGRPSGSPVVWRALASRSGAAPEWAGLRAASRRWPPWILPGWRTYWSRWTGRRLTSPPRFSGSGLVPSGVALPAPSPRAPRRSRRGPLEAALRSRPTVGRVSYLNRVSPWGLVRLLGAGELEPRGPLLLDILPSGGEGTLGGRLGEVPVHAKTGTLTAISALSGFVWLQRCET